MNPEETAEGKSNPWEIDSFALDLRSLTIVEDEEVASYSDKLLVLPRNNDTSRGYSPARTASLRMSSTVEGSPAKKVTHCRM